MNTPGTKDHNASNRLGLIDRREMIVAAAATGGLMSTSQLFAADPERSDDQGYIDAHSHVWTPDLDRYPLDKRYDVAAMRPESFTATQLLDLANKSGVNRVVLIQMSFYGYDNSYMLDCIANHPRRFSGVAVIDPDDQPAEKMEKLRPAGVRGFRIASKQSNVDTWLASDGMKQMWAGAAEHQMAICPLINPSYLESVDAMCVRFPNTTVVLDHFARVGIDGTIHDKDLSTLCKLARHKNVHVKVSAFYALGKKKPPYTDLGPMIKRLVNEFGANRLMWATDCPYQAQGDHTFEASIALIRDQLDFLTQQDRNQILRGTAERVFFDGI